MLPTSISSRKAYKDFWQNHISEGDTVNSMSNARGMEAARGSSPRPRGEPRSRRRRGEKTGGMKASG
ncbi:MAG: hypothetical protein QXY81_06080, partial [Desulfurococcus sp.]